MLQLPVRSRVTSAAFPGDPGRPGAWLSERGEILRSLPGRCVFRGRAAGIPVVAKEYSPASLRGRLRGYAEREAARAEEAARRGVPVVEPLAWARLQDGRELLLLREETDAHPLRRVVENGLRTGHGRHAAAGAVGELFARMHNAGVRHSDPHAGNVLLRPDGTAVLADAWNLRAGTYLTPEERAKEIAAFAPFFLVYASRIDLLAFWGAYGRAAGLAPQVLEALRQRVAASLPGAFRRIARSRSRRAFRRGREIRAGAFSGTAFGPLDAGTLDAIAARARDLRPADDVWKQSPTAWTFVVPAPQGELVVKVYLPKKLSRTLRAAFSRTRAERAVRAEHAFLHRGLRAPEVVAVLRDGRFARRSILITRRLPRSAEPVEAAFAALAPAEARRAAARIGRTLRRMHDRGLRQRDMKKDNLLFDRGAGSLWFVDFDGVRETRRGGLAWRTRARDLGRLAGSLLDTAAVPTGLRLRALDAYLGGEAPPGYPAGDFARLVAGIARAERRRRMEKVRAAGEEGKEKQR